MSAKKVKQLSVFCLSALVAAHTFMPVTFAQSVRGDVPINELTFPDPVFRAWVSSPQNLGGVGSDGFLSAQELAGIQKLYFPRNSGAQASSLKGIEHFTALEVLSVSNHLLTELDLNANTQLEYLYCSYNQLDSLDLSGQPNLKYLYTEYNRLTQLNLASNTQLETVYAGYNQLANVTLGQNSKLTLLDLFDNQLTQLDVTALSNLEYLNVSYNKLASLNLSQNGKINVGGFWAENNLLTQLQLPNLEGYTIALERISPQKPQTGYDLIGWYGDESHQQAVTEPISAQGQTLYGKREANTYSIHFSANGGKGSMPSQSGTYDQQLSLTSNTFSRTGYTFSGWNTAPNGRGTSYTDGQQVENLAGRYLGQSITLYAQWTPVEYTIQYDKNHDEATGSMDSTSATYGESVTLSAVEFENSRFEFAGWATQSDGPVVFPEGSSVNYLGTQQGETVTLYAIWKLTPEETQRPYLQQLDESFGQYNNSDYTPQDWQAIVALYQDGQDQITAEDSDTSLMQSILDETKTQMEQVPTYQERMNQLKQDWEDTHQAILDKVQEKNLTSAQAETAATQAADALAAAEIQALADSTGLEETIAYEMAVEVQEQLLTTLENLEDLRTGAQWLAALEGLDTLATTQVQSTHRDALTAALRSYEELDPQVQAYLSQQVEGNLNSHLQLAEAKSAAVYSVQFHYSTLDLSQYSQQGQQALIAARDAAIAAIEGSADSQQAQQQTQEGIAALDTVLTADEEQNQPPVTPPGGDGDSDGDGTDNGNGDTGSGGNGGTGNGGSGNSGSGNGNTGSGEDTGSNWTDGLESDDDDDNASQPQSPSQPEEDSSSESSGKPHNPNTSDPGILAPLTAALGGALTAILSFTKSRKK